MRIKLVGVSIDELQLALKYSGLFVESDGDYAEIKAIPSFLVSANHTQCGCAASRQLAELKDRVGQKVKTLQAQHEEMGYKVQEMAILLGKHELRRERDLDYVARGKHARGEKEYVDAKVRLANIEFWEKLGDKFGLGSESDFIKSEVK